MVRNLEIDVLYGSGVAGRSGEGHRADNGMRKLIKTFFFLLCSVLASEACFHDEEVRIQAAERLFELLKLGGWAMYFELIETSYC